MKRPTHIPVLEHLRGCAALAVCLGHFTNGSANFLSDDDPVKMAGAFGRLGVDAFFVISGFVIPYALYLRSYRLQDGASFLARRLKRLEPPYLISIVLIVVLNWISSMAPGYRGQPFGLEWAQLLAHIGYLNSVLHFGWLNDAFWTLAIEFQYYIFVALAFPLLVAGHPVVRRAAPGAIALLGFAGPRDGALLPYWLPLFAIGMVTFQRYAELISRQWCVAILIGVGGLCFLVIGFSHTIVGVGTALAILLIAAREMPRVLAPIAFAGSISYSLYLLHGPIGVRVINLVDRFPGSVVTRYAAILVALVISIACAYAFWWAVERPSQRWARSAPMDRTAVGRPLGNVDVRKG